MEKHVAEPLSQPKQPKGKNDQSNKTDNQVKDHHQENIGLHFRIESGFFQNNILHRLTTVKLARMGPTGVFVNKNWNSGNVSKALKMPQNSIFGFHIKDYLCRS
jgi:hypothetical protein